MAEASPGGNIPDRERRGNCAVLFLVEGINLLLCHIALFVRMTF